MTQVAYETKEGEYRIAELVETKGGWSTILFEGETLKIRNGQLADLSDDPEIEEIAELEDEDDRNGDVFPRGYREHYTKTRMGAKTLVDCGDEVAAHLRGSSLEEVAKMAEQVLGERNALGWILFYTDDRLAQGKKPLNPGMVRMNLGNRIRKALAKLAEEATEGNIEE